MSRTSHRLPYADEIALRATCAECGHSYVFYVRAGSGRQINDFRACRGECHKLQPWRSTRHEIEDYRL